MNSFLIKKMTFSFFFKIEIYSGFFIEGFIIE